MKQDYKALDVAVKHCLNHGASLEDAYKIIKDPNKNTRKILPSLTPEDVLEICEMRHDNIVTIYRLTIILLTVILLGTIAILV